MSKKSAIYVCEECSNMLETLRQASACIPECCDKPMKLVEENTVEASKEKHVPVIETLADGVHVKVGSVAHPMEKEHFIEWIEIITDSGKGSYRIYLEPGAKPEAFFPIKGKVIAARESCNLHGLWKA